MAIILVAGFYLRVHNLGIESLGEDELNKLQTVDEYRENGLSGKNGEHPFLMKGLQAASIAAAENINASFAGKVPFISPEAALRFPVALFGSFTALFLFLLLRELFGPSIGLVSAALWAVEPMAIGFDRVAKEDSLVLFFFLLSQFFWVRSQTKAERGEPGWFKYAAASGAAFAGLMASKYYPHLLAITGAYYNVFRNLPDKKWDLGKRRWLQFVIIMGLTFLVLNPTILLPDTWHEMLKFSSEKRIGHDSYEFWGGLYKNQMTAWLSGVPWTFYYVFIAVKTTLPVLVLFLAGLPLILRRKMGDGRFLLFFWAFFWFLPFTFLGGKFTRYFTFAEPLILVLAAVAFVYFARLLTQKLPTAVQGIAHGVLLAALVAVPLISSISVSPHFRLYTNALGGGMANAGAFFPHDEFYDASTREIADNLATLAAPGSTVASETPGLLDHYLRQSGRTDIKLISLSDKAELSKISANDYVVIARGRRYFSNTAYVNYLKASAAPVSQIDLDGVPAVMIYRLDAAAADQIKALAAK